ncbi:MAG: hypothetical protein RL338_1449 [Chloroflexota bacterium]|jgi:RNA polymerase sigma-70 factor (ECF subfamily)
MAVNDQDRAARFERMWAATRDPIVRYLARRAAPDAVEDLFAEVMTVAWRRLADIPVGDELPWLYGTARRVLANRRRADGRLGRLLERLALVERRTGPGEPAVHGTDPALTAAMTRLTKADAELLRLWAWEELQPREIALVLGITPNAVSIRLHRAKARLRDRLAADHAVERGGKGPESIGHLTGVERTEAR